VVTLPLILLAIPSVIIGFYTITPLLFGTYFGDSIFIDLARHPVMKELAEEFHGPVAMAIHAFTSPVLGLVVLGVLTAAIGYLWAPGLPTKFAQTFAPIKKLFDNKYYLDDLNQAVFAKGLIWIGGILTIGVITMFGLAIAGATLGEHQGWGYGHHQMFDGQDRGMMDWNDN